MGGGALIRRRQPETYVDVGVQMHQFSYGESESPSLNSSVITYRPTTLCRGSTMIRGGTGLRPEMPPAHIRCFCRRCWMNLAASSPTSQGLVLHEFDLGDRLRSLWHFLHNTPALERLVLNSCKVRLFLQNAYVLRENTIVRLDI